MAIQGKNWSKQGEKFTKISYKGKVSGEKNKNIEVVMKTLGPSAFGDLSFKQIKFVKEYMKHGIGTRAAVAAGYTEKGANKTAIRLLRTDEVRKAMAEVKEALKKDLVYTNEKAIMEIDFNIKLAQELKQMTAVAKLVELKTRITGIFEDKVTVQHKLKGGFVLNISGIERKPAIDVTPGAKQIGESRTDTED